MTKPRKNNADYFPHDNKMWSDRKIVALRNKFGMEGYAIWNLLLETLCDCENFELDLNEYELELLADFWGVERGNLKNVLEFMEKIRLVHRRKNKIFCKNLKERMKPLLDERERKRKWAKDAAKRRFDGEGSSVGLDGCSEVLDVYYPSSSDQVSATSMRKESKGKKSRVKKIIENKGRSKRRIGRSSSAQSSFARGSPQKMTLQDFNQFWERYPKKRSKQKAIDKYMRLDRNLLPSILGALDRQKRTYEWQKEGGQFIPFPTTWLNGRRWEDDIEPSEFNHPHHEKTWRHCPAPRGFVSSDGDADIIITEEDVQ